MCQYEDIIIISIHRVHRKTCFFNLCIQYFLYNFFFFFDIELNFISFLFYFLIQLGSVANTPRM